jgi:excisionase family DNA binding protein
MAAVDPSDILLTPSEVAEIFRVHPRTITTWTKAGRLKFTFLPGGKIRRYYQEDVYAVLRGEGTEAQRLARAEAAKRGE